MEGEILVWHASDSAAPARKALPRRRIVDMEGPLPKAAEVPRNLRPPTPTLAVGLGSLAPKIQGALVRAAERKVRYEIASIAGLNVFLKETLASWKRKVRQAIALTFKLAEAEALAADDAVVEIEVAKGRRRDWEEACGKARLLWDIAKGLGDREGWCWRDEVEDLLSPAERVFFGQERVESYPSYEAFAAAGPPDVSWEGGFWKGDRDVNPGRKIASGAGASVGEAVGAVEAVGGRRFVDFDLLDRIAARRFGELEGLLREGLGREELANRIAEIAEEWRGGSDVDDTKQEMVIMDLQSATKGNGSGKHGARAREKETVTAKDVGKMPAGLADSVQNEDAAKAKDMVKDPPKQPEKPAGIAAAAADKAPEAAPAAKKRTSAPKSDLYLEPDVAVEAALSEDQLFAFSVLERVHQVLARMPAQIMRTDFEARLGKNDLDEKLNAAVMKVFEAAEFEDTTDPKVPKFWTTAQQIRRAFVATYVK